MPGRMKYTEPELWDSFLPAFDDLGRTLEKMEREAKEDQWNGEN